MTFTKLILIIFLPALCWAQILPPQTLWVDYYGGTGDETANCLLNTDDGGYVTAGYTTSWGMIGDFYIVKTDSGGLLEWEKWYGSDYLDEARGIVKVGDQGYAVFGTSNLYGFGDSNLFLVRLDLQGDTLWTRSIDTGENEIGNSIAATADGGFLLTGESDSYGVAMSDVLLVRVDSWGDTLWTKNIGREDFSDEMGNDAVITADGGCAVLGNTTLAGNDSLFIWLLRTDEYGDTLWTKLFAIDQFNSGQSIELTEDGGFLICGNTQQQYGGSSQVLFIKTDSNGEIVFSEAYDINQSAKGYSVSIFADGNYLIAGETYISNVTNNDALLMKVDDTGDILWTQTVGVFGNENATDALVFDNGDYTFTGTSSLGQYGYNDVWMVHLTDRPIAHISPSPLLFPPTVIGNTSEMVLYLSNIGNLELKIDSLTLLNPINFSASWNDADSLLLPGDSIQISISFSPGDTILYPDSLHYHGNADLARGGIYGIGLADLSSKIQPKLSSPKSMGLYAYPNPFNASTQFNLYLPVSGDAKLVIFDVLGRQIVTLLDDRLSAGVHHVIWNAEDIANGLYFVALECAGQRVTQKLVLLK